MEKGYLQYKILKPFYRNAGHNMCDDFKEYVSSADNLLDLGCGSGILAETIEDRFGIKVEGVDIIDMRAVDISFRKYDGKDLSFIPDDSFDVVLISYVLHHAEDPISILKQAGRIAKKYVIIYEDMNEGVIGRAYCKLHGKCFNNLLQGNNVEAKFFTEREWRNIFKDLNLEILKVKSKPYFLNPVKRKMFVLKKGV